MQRFKKLYIYGDSNTYGYNPLASCYDDDRLPEEKRWPVILQNNLKSSIEIVEDGVNGRCLPVSESERERFIKSLERYGKLDYIAVMLGTNDILNQASPAPEEISEYMGKLINSIRSVYEDCKCIVITPPKMGFPEGHSMHGYQETNKKLRELYKLISERENTGFIDTGNWDIDLFYDGIHLTECGNVQFAENMLKTLKDLEIY